MVFERFGDINLATTPPHYIEHSEGSPQLSIQPYTYPVITDRCGRGYTTFMASRPIRQSRPYHFLLATTQATVRGAT